MALNGLQIKKTAHKHEQNSVIDIEKFRQEFHTRDVNMTNVYLSLNSDKEISKINVNLTKDLMSMYEGLIIKYLELKLNSKIVYEYSLVNLFVIYENKSVMGIITTNI